MLYVQTTPNGFLFFLIIVDCAKCCFADACILYCLASYLIQVKTLYVVLVKIYFYLAACSRATLVVSLRLLSYTMAAVAWCPAASSP
jgi:hypothetical protein